MTRFVIDRSCTTSLRKMKNPWMKWPRRQGMEVNYPLSYFPVMFGTFGRGVVKLRVGILFPIEDQYMKVIAKELQTQNFHFGQPGRLLLTSFHSLQMQVDTCSDHQAVCRVLGRNDWPGTSRKISGKSSYRNPFERIM